MASDAEIQLNDPQTLYRRWEESQWSLFEIDLARDQAQWPQMSDEDQGLVYWALSSLMVPRSGSRPGSPGSSPATRRSTTTRQFGYGVWFLREAVRDSPAAADAVRATLRELLPSVAESLSPPGRDGDTDWDALGASASEIREFALGGLTRRLEIIGVPLDSL